MHRLRFVAEFVACAALGALAGVMLRHNDELYLALLILGLALCAAFLAHLLLGLRARWKFHYITICRFFALAIVALGCFIAFANFTNNTDRQAARDYLNQIKPALEDYRQNNGHYPNALGDLHDLRTPPVGFLYRRDNDATPGGGDTYRVDYFSLEYWSGSNTWFDDD